MCRDGSRITRFFVCLLWCSTEFVFWEENKHIHPEFNFIEISHSKSLTSYKLISIGIGEVMIVIIVCHSIIYKGRGLECILLLLLLLACLLLLAEWIMFTLIQIEILWNLGCPRIFETDHIIWKILVGKSATGAVTTQRPMFILFTPWLGLGLPTCKKKIETAFL